VQSNNKKSKRSVRQDRKGEVAVSKLFDLKLNPNRMAKEDAFDEYQNPYQLKASTKAGVSTNRGFGPTTVQNLRNIYIVISWGKSYSNSFLVERTFFLAPYHINPWLDEKVAHFKIQIDEAQRVIDTCRNSGFDEDRLTRLEKRLHNGMLMNNPDIPKRYVLQYGIEITKDFPNRLRELVQLHPLNTQ
jgi:hypothetical protein